MNNRIYLCKPGGVILGVLNVKDSDVLLYKHANNTWELTFSINRYNGEKEETPFYSSINEGMELLLIEENSQFRFLVDSEPNVKSDGITETKDITAHSIECELSYKFLKNFKINCGTKESQEYLVGYYDDNGNFINMNLNPYTNLPIDYIVIYNNYANDLSKILAKLDNSSITVNSLTGLITCDDTTKKLLKTLYTNYPRLSCDCYYDTNDNSYKCHIYLNINDKDEIYIISPTGDFSYTTLRKGILNLIVFYQKYGHQLSLIDLALENAQISGWSVGDIPSEIARKKYNFEIEEQDILSFFRQTCSSVMKVIFEFDRFDRQVDIVDISNEDKNHDTGVFVTFRNLMNTFEVRTSSTEGIKTKFYPKGANNLGILYTNFGEDNIVNIDWFVDKINEYDDYQYVSEEFHDKYHQWNNFKFNTPVTYTINGDDITYNNRREAYRELSKIYNQYTIDIDKLQNLLPNEGCNVDFTTFTFKELNTAWKAYKSALETLEQLYMSEYNLVSFNEDTLDAVDINNNTISENDSKYIKNTYFWNDFICYRDTIIPNVENALKMYVLTNGDGELDTSQMDAEGNWIEYAGGNPWYNSDAKRVTSNKSDEFLYDMTLYGTIELEAKKKAWINAAATLFKQGYILIGNSIPEKIPVAGAYTYNTADTVGWEKLPDELKATFKNKEAFIQGLNEFLDYVGSSDRDNSLTKTVSKGVAVLAEEARVEKQAEIDNLLLEQSNVNELRKEIATEVMIKNYTFTEEELALYYKLIREADYNNENILITNLDDIVTTINAQEELYQDALIALSEKAQPQLSFSTGLDNIFALKEYSALADSIDLYNYIRISNGLYADDFIKLRIVGIKYNPIVKTNTLELEFSNMIYSINGISDLTYLFNSMNGNSGSVASGGSSSTSNGGTYGTNDAEITIANNMLNALLSTRTFSSTISNLVIQELSDNVNAQNLMSSTGIFNKLINGEILIGQDITTQIQNPNNNDLSIEKIKVIEYPHLVVVTAKLVGLNTFTPTTLIENLPIPISDNFYFVGKGNNSNVNYKISDGNISFVSSSQQITKNAEYTFSISYAI